MPQNQQGEIVAGGVPVKRRGYTTVAKDQKSQVGQTEQELGQLMLFLQLMREAGLDVEQGMRMAISNRAMCERLAGFWKMGGYPPNKIHTAARQTGIQVFGIEEAVKYLKIIPKEADLWELRLMPFRSNNFRMLRMYRRSYFLVAVPSVSILELRNMPSAQGLFCKQSWYEREPWAKDPGLPRWLMICKTPAIDSLSKNWDEQLEIVGEDTVPTARELAYTLAIYFLAMGKRLFQDIGIRSMDVDSDLGQQIVAVNSHSGGITFEISDNKDSSADLGVAVSKNAQKTHRL